MFREEFKRSENGTLLSSTIENISTFNCMFCSCTQVILVSIWQEILRCCSVDNNTAVQGMNGCQFVL